MAAERLSAGVYKVNGKTINAKSAAEAQTIYDKQQKKSPSGGDTKKADTKKPAAKNPVKVAGDFTDPAKVAKAQDLENEKIARENVNLNRIDESNAFGSRDYIQNPDGTFSIKDSLSPEQQKLIDAQTRTGTVGSNIAEGLLGGMPKEYNADSLNQYLPQGSDAARQGTYDATYGMIARDFERDRGEERQSVEQELADRGYTPGSPQYEARMKRFDQGWSDRELSARNQATLSGNQEFQNSFGRDQTNYTNRLGNYQSNFTMPTQIAGSLQGLGQVYNPQFGQGVTPVERQATNFGDYYGTATSANIARSQGGGGGGGGQQAPAVQYPSMGGVAGAGATQKPKGPTIGQNIVSGITNGVTAGAVNNYTMKQQG